MVVVFVWSRQIIQQQSVLNSFKNYPLGYTGSRAQLREKFEEVDFDQLGQQDNVVVNNKVILSARLWKGSTVFQSKWHYGKRDPRQSNHSMVLPTILILSRSSKMSWYVGDVVVYLEHKHQNQVYYLAVISVAKRSRLDKFNVLVITLFDENEAKKVIVCTVEDIISLAGF
ncbi:hypothetical protein A0J61_11609, partial [Choanephora cucurbitarum]